MGPVLGGPALSACLERDKSMDSLPLFLAHIDCDHPRYCMERGEGPDGPFVNVTGGPPPIEAYPPAIRELLRVRREHRGYRPDNEQLVLVAWILQDIASRNSFEHRLNAAAFLVGWVADHT